jgi:hypothetical protein
MSAARQLNEPLRHLWPASRKGARLPIRTARLFGALDEPVILRGTMPLKGSENENK